ncbi:MULTISPECIES: exodeoxyribonuclease VII large subunit [environmental samples]|uniref:exodeoxyribonuclease VII large subunit n=1 Tax=Oscillibacter sp. CAG:155 TaxID=1262910 RepID=UPI00033B3422|nr:MULTISPECIES: exodeoxyribonuclease VII large subunit [environmental samples]CDC70885.1 exodeoxyribonuclease 7 large subunit [Oscillibacter sp. CAG:155]
MEQHVFGVAEVNQLVKQLLDGEPMLQNIYVRGELSNYKMYPSGHHYFTLKDADGALRCVMFRGQASRLRFRPENGMQVIARGRITVFPRDGAYQLYCDALTPEGAGDLAVAFEQLKAKLHAEGLFDPAHKKPLPRYPQRIAVVTSAAGAAVHDMIRILRRRYPIAKVILLPVRVQGTEAPPEIAGAIRYADRWKIGDVIITGRGGGSMEDLWAFNDERVARAIYDCETPVISAVGHEPDVTIADFVADARASTPSNAAEIAVPDQVELLRWLRGAGDRMVQCETGRLEAARQRLDNLASKRVMRDQLAYVQDKRMELAHLQQRLGDLSGALLSRRRQRFSALAAALDAMSPLKVLGRGYAVARSQDGTILKSGREVAPGDRVSVTLSEGGFDAVVDRSYTKEDQT